MFAWPESLRTSVRLLRAHPVISIALGSAIVLSLCSVCVGFGAIVGPWFVCELYGAQIAAATGSWRPRTSSWIGAGLVVAATVLVVAGAGWLSVLGFGPDIPTADAAEAPLPWPDTLRRIGLVAGSTALAVGFIGPFLYAPLVLIDRGGQIGGAVVESAWLVARDGVLRHLAVTFVIYLLQLSPALVAAMLVARIVERAATPWGFVIAIPFLTLSIPLGQGILTARYLARRDLLASPRTVLARGRPPRSLVALLVAILVAPLAGLALLGATATRPLHPVERPAPAGEVLVDQMLSGPARIDVPDSTLIIQVARDSLQVHAGDGDGAGEIPSSWRAPIDRVRVIQTDDLYAIEVHAGGRVFHDRVDGAAERVDDSTPNRLAQHVPTWALLCILSAFVACALLLVRTLAPLGALRAAGNATPEERRRARTAAHATALRWGLVIAPFSIASLIGGWVSIGWL